MNKLNNTSNTYLVLCYHYLRNRADKDLFPRILGTLWDDFEDHLSMLQDSFNIVSFADVMNFHENNQKFPSGKPNVLLTFDDGLAEHAQASDILAKKGIKALFFIPSCLITEKVPINSTILHYTIARYGIFSFLEEYESALSIFNLSCSDYRIHFTKGIDDPWETISQIKKMFKYKLSQTDSQRILMRIYKNKLLKDYPEIFKLMHLGKEQIKKIISLGHYIGAHTHSHVSIGSANLSKQNFNKEVVESKNILEDKLNTKIDSISYPFGEKKDYDNMEQELRKIGIAKAGFIAEPGLNTKQTSPFKIARYLVLKADTIEMLHNKLMLLQKNKEVVWKY